MPKDLWERVAQGRVGPTKVLQAHVLEVTSHAKSVGDGLASEIKNKVTASVKGGFCGLPGTRGHVLLLAQLYPKPLKDAANKSGMWSACRIIYGYYSDRVFEGCASQDFQKFNGSMSYRFRMGPNSVPEQAHRKKLVVRKGFCACSSCCAPKFDFSNRRFSSLFGRSRREECPPLKPVRGALPAVMEIPEFSATLKAGEFRAVDVAEDQVLINSD